MTPIEELLTIKEVMARLRVSRATIYRLIEQGVLSPIKVGKGVRFEEGQISSLIGMNSKSFSADAIFTVKELGPSAEPVLWAELYEDLPLLRDKQLFLYPREGVTIEQVEAVRNALLAVIRGIAITDVDSAKMLDRPYAPWARRSDKEQ